MNHDVSGNRKLVWKEVGKAKDRKVGNCNNVKDRTGMIDSTEKS